MNGCDIGEKSVGDNSDSASTGKEPRCLSSSNNINIVSGLRSRAAWCLQPIGGFTVLSRWC